MPSCRSYLKDETVSTCVKSRNPLGVIVLVLLLVSAAFLFTAYYISNSSSHKPTSEPVPQGLSTFITEFSDLNWCPNNTAVSAEVLDLNDTATATTTESLYKSKSSACLQVVAVISGDQYLQFKNTSVYRASLPWSRLFHHDGVEKETKVQLTYLIQHNLSTSTKHSTDVLVPTYVNISSSHVLPGYIRDASTCQFPLHDHANKMVVTPCPNSMPRFRIDQKWEHDLNIFVSVEEGRMNIHLMYTSYFLLISAISVIAYSTIRNRNASKLSNKNKLPQKMQIAVY